MRAHTVTHNNILTVRLLFHRVGRYTDSVSRIELNRPFIETIRDITEEGKLIIIIIMNIQTAQSIRYLFFNFYYQKKSRIANGIDYLTFFTRSITRNHCYL